MVLTLTLLLGRLPPGGSTLTRPATRDQDAAPHYISHFTLGRINSEGPSNHTDKYQG